MSGRADAARPPSGPSRVLEHEAAALKGVMNQQERVLRSARAAFQGDRDPIAIFAETVALSSVVHVRAMIEIQRAGDERMQALSRGQAAYGAELPFPGVLSLFGVAPLDPVRFRTGLLIVIITTSLAVFGLGVVVGKF